MPHNRRVIFRFRGTVRHDVNMDGFTVPYIVIEKRKGRRWLNKV